MIIKKLIVMKIIKSIRQGKIIIHHKNVLMEKIIQNTIKNVWINIKQLIRRLNNLIK